MQDDTLNDGNDTVAEEDIQPSTSEVFLPCPLNNYQLWKIIVSVN